MFDLSKFESQRSDVWKVAAGSPSRADVREEDMSREMCLHGITRNSVFKNRFVFCAPGWSEGTLGKAVGLRSVAKEVREI